MTDWSICTRTDWFNRSNDWCNAFPVIYFFDCLQQVWLLGTDHIVRDENWGNSITHCSIFSGPPLAKCIIKRCLTIIFSTESKICFLYGAWLPLALLFSPCVKKMSHSQLFHLPPPNCMTSPSNHEIHWPTQIFCMTLLFLQVCNFLEEGGIGKNSVWC